MPRRRIKRTALTFLLAACLYGVASAETTNLPSGVGIEFTSPDTTPAGTDLVWALTLTNSSGLTRSCHITMDADSLGYNGQFLGHVSTMIVTNEVPAGGTRTVEVRVAPSEYARWYGKSSTFELAAFVGVEGTEDLWFGEGRTIMTTATNLLVISPPPPIPRGHSCTGTVTYVNPLPLAIHNVKVYLTADPGMSTDNALREDTFDVGTIAAQGLISVSTNYIPGKAGTHNVSVFISADELAGVTGFTGVRVTEP